MRAGVREAKERALLAGDVPMAPNTGPLLLLGVRREWGIIYSVRVISMGVIFLYSLRTTNTFLASGFRAWGIKNGRPVCPHWVTIPELPSEL